MAITKVRWGPDWCSCIVTYAYDSSVPQDQIVFVGDTIERKCADHESITNADELYNVLVKESRNKERARNAIIQLLPNTLVLLVDGEKTQDMSKLDITFQYSGDQKHRTLKALFKTLTVTLNTSQKNALRNGLKNILVSDPLAEENQIGIYDLDFPNDKLNL